MFSRYVSLGLSVGYVSRPLLESQIDGCRSMNFPDQPHVNRIVEALWRHPSGHAAVMVGAGFSMNARKASPASSKMSPWKEVTEALCDQLYPTGDNDRRTLAIQESSGTSGYLRLAQEFEVAFGRDALHTLIGELVPDADYEPDQLHRRLLTLPWQDVFTTNWDTLLERAASEVHGRNYRIVRTMAEIPGSNSPRIVKLHGSFPAYHPFIFTEEDYRTYPLRFAPFVNMVQQSLLENVYCLIGFSGDDPNFLHWLGWVRDNLGISAPKTYLVGWLELSPHRRRMLEDRNVMPIDLARHPAADNWQEHLRHRHAVDWFLHALERGKPYDFTLWPEPLDLSGTDIPAHLHPVPEVPVRAPRKEKHRSAENLGDPVAAIREIVAIWTHNRSLYPGWLVLPDPQRWRLCSDAADWTEEVIKVAPNLPPLERLNAIRELIWRTERAMLPLSTALDDAALATLGIFDCFARTIGGQEEVSRPEWSHIRECWREVGLALITAARQRFDRSAFDRRCAMLVPFEGDDDETRNRLHHERCLWALYEQELESLASLLRKWNVSDIDPVWKIRKIGLLLELDRLHEAVPLLDEAIRVLRRDSSKAANLANPSRESWALKISLAFDRPFRGADLPNIDLPDAFDRWRELVAQNCDASSDYRSLREAIRGEGGWARTDFERGPLFDLGARRGRAITYTTGPSYQVRAALQATRLAEIAGLPPSTNNVAIASDILSDSAEMLAQQNPGLAARLVLRLASSEDDRLLNTIFSRSAVARMSTSDVESLVAIVQRMINYAMQKDDRNGRIREERSSFWITRLRVAMEVLSRLVTRLPEAAAEGVLNQATEFYRNPNLAHEHWLRDGIAHLLRRSAGAVSPMTLVDRALSLIELPIAFLDGFDVCDRTYPEPAELFNDDLPAPSRLPDTEQRWSEVVRLVVKGLTANNKEARRRAGNRSWWLKRWNLLTSDEEKNVAAALWEPSRTQRGGLPRDTGFFDWVFLVLPEPGQGIAERKFRDVYISPSSATRDADLERNLIAIGRALAALKGLGAPQLDLSDGDKAYLISLLDRWAVTSVPQSQEEETSHSSDDIEHVSEILPKLRVPLDIAENILARAEALNASQVPAFTLMAAITKALPEKLDSLALQFRLGIASDKDYLIEGTLRGLQLWLKLAVDPDVQVPNPPEDLIKEIGLLIVARRKSALFEGLRIARWIFAEGSTHWKATIADSCAQGLGYLLEELRYSRNQDDAARDVPLERWACAHLALAMRESGFGDHSAVAQWMEALNDDPLPEVRHAQMPRRKQDRPAGTSIER
jgi:hypothetical protein